MRVSFQPDHSTLTLRLSRKNIVSLLHMLDADDKAVPALMGRDNNIEILVLPEEDEPHYADRDAGRMSWEADDD